jgi:hypothetical protein
MKKILAFTISLLFAAGIAYVTTFRTSFTKLAFRTSFTNAL